MIYIFFSICCSVFVSVLLKLAKRYNIDTRQAIMWNYPMAAVLTVFFYSPSIPSITASLYPVYVALGLLLPSLFVILALSVRYTGIVRTDIAQRLSLFIPVAASFIIFNEIASITKIAGIALAVAAIFCSISWRKTSITRRSAWIYPVVVFIGMGIIDVLFKQIAKTTAIPFTSSLLIVFILAFLVSFFYMFVLFISGKTKFYLANFVCGLVLGIGNFGNILFYLKAHQALANDPSLVFSSMNIGVILVGSLVGVLIFREKLSRLNYIGLILSVIAIMILTFA